MTPHEALAEGRLAEAVRLAETAADPSDPAAQRLLVDLLAFAGRLDEALDHLGRIRTDDPDWFEAERGLRQVLTADRKRQGGGEPRIVPQPAPRHAADRLTAIRHLRDRRPKAAVRWIDAADAAAPHPRGFLDGREFEGLRDADDRTASVLEALADGEYVWFPWESLRKVALAPASVLIDQLYRPASVTLKDGTTMGVRLPLVYAGSHTADDAFALGMETDYVNPDDGPTRCVGAKLLLVDSGAEVPLAECRMIEVR